MDYFITLTNKYNQKISIALHTIVEVVESKNGSKITTTGLNYNVAWGGYLRYRVSVKESYAEVIEKIKQANKAG